MRLELFYQKLKDAIKILLAIICNFEKTKTKFYEV
jgi:hypothetical protein